MGHADYFHPGSWNVICQECGEKWKAFDIRKRWDGFYVCPFCSENRHPQDFIKGVPDEQDVPFSTGNLDYVYSGTVGTQFIQPTSGFSVTILDAIETFFIDPIGPLTSGTITMPAAPPQGQLVRLYSNQNINGLTVSPNAGQTITNAPTSLVGTEPVLYKYSGTVWQRQVYA